MAWTFFGVGGGSQIMRPAQCEAAYKTGEIESRVGKLNTLVLLDNYHVTALLDGNKCTLYNGKPLCVPKILHMCQNFR